MIAIDQRPNTELSREELIKKVWRLEEDRDKLVHRVASLTATIPNKNTKYYTDIISEQRRLIAKLRGDKIESMISDNMGVLDFVSAFYAVPKKDIKYKRRFTKLVQARAAVTYIMRNMGKTYVEIGKTLNRDHATIINLSRNFDKYLDEHTKKILDNYIYYGNNNNQGGKLPGSRTQTPQQVPEDQCAASV